LTVSVIVPLYNGRDIIGDCLSSVPPGVEVVVVDDASTDGAPDVVAELFPGARLLLADVNSGFASTANRGLRAASGEVCVVLNSDARLQPGALERLVAAFDADPAVGVAGPRLVFPDGSHQVSAAYFLNVGNLAAGSFALTEAYQRLRPSGRFRWQAALTRRQHEVSRPVDWVHGTCIALRRACIEATGGFDPGYRMYVEECDLCWRAHHAGFGVRYVAEAIVVHLGGVSAGRDAAQQARHNLDGEARFLTLAYGVSVLPRWRRARILSSAVKAALLLPLGLLDERLRDRWRWHAAAVRYLLSGLPGPRPT